jgi:uncharacterized protein
VRQVPASKERQGVKFTLCITQQCSLRCGYCYVGKTDAVMTTEVARLVVDWIFRHAAPDEPIDIGFFGGEPLLAFSVLQEAVGLIEAHPGYDPDRVILSVISNGTIFSGEISTYLKDHRVRYGLSFDGPPEVQDRFRRFADGRPSSPAVQATSCAGRAARLRAEEASVAIRTGFGSRRLTAR